MNLIQTLVNAVFATIMTLVMTYLAKVTADTAFIIGVVVFIGLEIRADLRRVEQRLKENHFFLDTERDEEEA